MSGRGLMKKIKPNAKSKRKLKKVGKGVGIYGATAAGLAAATAMQNRELIRLLLK